MGHYTWYTSTPVSNDVTTRPVPLLLFFLRVFKQVIYIERLNHTKLVWTGRCLPARLAQRPQFCVFYSFKGRVFFFMFFVLATRNARKAGGLLCSLSLFSVRHHRYLQEPRSRRRTLYSMYSSSRYLVHNNTNRGLLPLSCFLFFFVGLRLFSGAYRCIYSEYQPRPRLLFLYFWLHPPCLCCFSRSLSGSWDGRRAQLTG